WLGAAAGVGIVLAAAAEVGAQAQMFPSKRDAGGVSAYVLPPSAGWDAASDGWQRRAGATYGNSAIGNESPTPTRPGAVLTQSIGGVPRADYAVSILARGEARARLGGAGEWIDVRSAKANAYEWFELG